LFTTFPVDAFYGFLFNLKWKMIFVYFNFLTGFTGLTGLLFFSHFPGLPRHS